VTANLVTAGSLELSKPSYGRVGGPSRVRCGHLPLVWDRLVVRLAATSEFAWTIRVDPAGSVEATFPVPRVVSLRPRTATRIGTRFDAATQTRHHEGPAEPPYEIKAACVAAAVPRHNPMIAVYAHQHTRSIGLRSLSGIRLSSQPSTTGTS